MTHVVAIIPAKNSVDSVAATVTALIETGAVGEVLVVDDGSVDGTGESAAKAGARVGLMARSSCEALKRMTMSQCLALAGTTSQCSVSEEASGTKQVRSDA